MTEQLALLLDGQLCARCGEVKPLDAFSPSKRGKAGHYCRACSREYNRAWNRLDRLAAGVHPRQRRVCAHEGCELRPTSKGARYCALHRDNREPTSAEYRAVHARIVRTLGKATSHTCAHGGHPAEEWAYDHQDPDEVTGYTVRGHRCTYSLNAGHYMPLCRSCHAKFDGRRRYRFSLIPVGRGW